MRKRENAIAYNVEYWLLLFVALAHTEYNSRVWGGNARIKREASDYVCCALIYSKPDREWKEFAARRHFNEAEIPPAYRECANGMNMTELLQIAIKKYYLLSEDHNMKFNLFSLAQTALTVVDGVSAKQNEYKAESGAALSSFAHDTTISAGDRAMALARAALNQDWFDLANMGFDALVNLVSKEPLSYSDYLDAIGQYADVKIQQFSKEENLRFVGGECHLQVNEAEKSVKSNLELYFKNESDRWIKKTVTGNTGFHCFTAETLDADITDIRDENGRKFPIIAPN